VFSVGNFKLFSHDGGVEIVVPKADDMSILDVIAKVALH
jgi:hypothetical protein